MDPFAVASLALSGASLVQGAVRGGKARNLRGQYDQMESAIPMQDPGEVAQLDALRRRRAAFDAGTDPLTAYTSQQARNFGAQTQANLVRAGANPSSLLQAQAGVNNGLAQSGAMAAQRGAQLFGQEGQMVGAMANRAYNRQLSRANRVWSEYARAKEDSNAAIQAGLGMLPDVSFGSKMRPGGSNEMRRVAAQNTDTMEPILSPIARGDDVVNPLSYVPRPSSPTLYQL